MALVYQETRAEAVCSLEQDVLVLLNDKSRMKGDLHVRFREKFEVKVLLLTRLRGRELITPSYSINHIFNYLFCKSHRANLSHFALLEFLKIQHFSMLSQSARKYKLSCLG